MNVQREYSSCIDMGSGTNLVKDEFIPGGQLRYLSLRKYFLILY